MSLAIIIVLWTLRVILLGVVALYSGLVLTSYATDGAHSPLRLASGELARSFQQILVWSGVKVLDRCLRTLRVIWDLLAEASADVGEWFVNGRSARVQRKYRSHFL